MLVTPCRRGGRSVERPSDETHDSKPYETLGEIHRENVLLAAVDISENGLVETLNR